MLRLPFGTDRSCSSPMACAISVAGSETEHLTARTSRPRPEAAMPGFIAVYLPMSYMVGGYTLFLPRSCLTPIEMSFEEGMKLVLTGAVSRDSAHAKALDLEDAD